MTDAKCTCGGNITPHVIYTDKRKGTKDVVWYCDNGWADVEHKAVK